MDISTAKRIGSQQAIKAVTIGLVVAYSMMGLIMSDALWLFEFEYSKTILFAILATYILGFLFGRRTGVSILIDRNPSLLIGIGYCLLTVWIATFMTSLIGFFGEGIGRSDEPFTDYIWKPFMLVAFFGLIPTILIGLWWGYSIRSKGKKVE
jgi:ribose/xylose/arabinose/galactoside ABC-type transport system permease subunit